MKNHTMALARILTYSGALPFVACVVLSIWPISALEILFIAKCYGAVILSFLCGIHWAVYLFFSERCPRNLLITSNMVTLIAWLSLMAANPVIALVIQILGFMYLLLLDSQLNDVGIFPSWFYRVRQHATAVVILCLLIIVSLA